MVYCRMDGKETDSQRDEEHEAEIVDVDLGVCIFFGYAVIRNILVYQLDMIIWETSFITQNLIKYCHRSKVHLFL